MSRGGRRATARAAAGIAALMLALAACATPAPPPSSSVPAPAPSQPAVPAPLPAAPAGESPTVLPGWDDEDHLAAFNAWADSCRIARDPAARRQCERAG